MVNFLWDNLFRPDQKRKTIRLSLKENILFRNLTARELRFLETIIHERHYRPGEIIFHQGEMGVGMYIIAQGKVDITMTSAITGPVGQTAETFVTRLEAGDFFGELSLVEESGRRSASAVAVESSILIGFFKPDLLAVLDRNPSMGVKVVFRLGEVLGRRLKETTDRITLLKNELRNINHSAETRGPKT
jgi:CRP/FNR family cyclic AMP-dependent transcriptional regulator